MRSCENCKYMRTFLFVKGSGRINYTGLTAKCEKGRFLDENGGDTSFRLYKNRIPKPWNEAKYCNDFARVDFIREILELIIKARGRLDSSL